MHIYTQLQYWQKTDLKVPKVFCFIQHLFALIKYFQHTIFNDGTIFQDMNLS